MDPVLQPADDKLTAQAAQITALEAELAKPQRKAVVYVGLEKNPIGPDNKKPFWWAQPSNTGNTGGGSSKPHGTYTWSPGANGTTISIKPAGAYDNFFFYSVLPYPEAVPSHLRWSASDWAAALPADWQRSQQMEWQVEEFRAGFQYTCAWAVNPRTGLMYWAGAKKWQPFQAGGGIRSLAEPTCITCEFSLDHDAHTYTYEWIVVNGFMLKAGMVVPAVTTPPDRKEFSVAVQLDGNSNGAPYSGLLNNLMVEWE